MQIIAALGSAAYCAGMSPCPPFAMASPATATDLVLDLPGGRIAARRWGRPGAQPLLACHGWLDNAASFDPLLPLLLQQLPLDVLAVDLPGHGHSHWLPGPYSQPTQASHLLALLDALGWQQATLLGHSMGASLCALLAAALPERVQALVCIDALGPPSASAEDTVARLRRHLLATQPGQQRAPRALPSLEHAVRLRQQVNGLSAANARSLVERGLVQGQDGLWRWRSDPGLTLPSAVYLDEAQVQAMLRAIACPSLLLQSDPASPYGSAEQRQQRQLCVPQLEVVSLPGGHHLHMENPAACAEAIAGFMGKIP